MDTETIREALRTDFNATLRALADHIAQTYTGPEDTRIEIAHAIARHLGLEGWPSAWEGHVPKSRAEAVQLAREVLRQLCIIDKALDEAIARCEAQAGGRDE